MLHRSEIELMSPVGSRECLAAAIQGGADAIYFGIESLNMRAGSAHAFTISDLREIADICHSHNVKSYLTLNTIIYDGDIALMQEIIIAAKAAGVSAIIAADVAAMSFAREQGVEVHLSTQLNISNTIALRHYAQYADVVVLARELNMEQVTAIHNAIEAENICGPSGERVRIEMFCHGALCMAFSGKCYMSLHERNRSANRGECVQLCRRNYTVRDSETGYELAVGNPYIMSPKDLKTLDFLPTMLAAGVRVLKIEGRARSADYVRTVTECYNEALAAHFDGEFDDNCRARLNTRLATVFNRGFWDGYYMGRTMGEWSTVYGSAATERKVYVGDAIKYYSRLGVAEFSCKAATVSVGEKLLITGPTTGALYLTLEDPRVELNSVPIVEKGVHFSIKVPEKVRPSDKLYKIISTN